MPTLAVNAFTSLDWLTLAGYFLLLLVSGFVFSRKKQQDTREYFLGGRQMPVWAVAISVVATATSAATFIGAPQMAYMGDLTYLSANIATIIAVLLVAAFFIPVFYRRNVATVYELLEQQIGRPAKVAASWTFMIGRVFASGARIYIAAIPAALILFRDPHDAHLLIAVGVLTMVGIFYTLVGGIRSVIWTDVIQLFIFVAAAGAALVVLVHRIPVGADEILHSLQHPGPDESSKLTVLDVGVGVGGVEFSKYYTLLTALTGLLLLNLAAYGTDHDMVQRMLTCRSAARGSLSAIVAIAVNLPIVFLFMAVGLLLYVFYQRPDLMGSAAPVYPPVESPKIFVSFILHEMPSGLTGLLMAGLFAAALSSLNSALNAMGSTFVNDFYKHVRPGRTESHYVLIGRVAVIGWGVVLGLFACFCVFWHGRTADEPGQELINFALAVMTFAYSGLVAVFLTAMFTRRGSNRSVIAALLAGFLVTLIQQPQIWSRITPDTWPEMRLAFPWQMLIATTAAFAICCFGKRSCASTSQDAPLSTVSGVE